MDKNFIRIDDLVRQRMGGGEENERSGAWLNMRDLLDKEMPQQRRIGIFYWRRLFGLVAALSLVGTVCIGSYELSSFYKNGYNGDNTAEVVASNAANNEPNSAYELPVNDAINENAAKSNNREENNNRNNTVRNNAHEVNKQRHIAASYSAGTTEAGNKAIIDNPITVDSKTNKKVRRNTSASSQNGGEIANNTANSKDVNAEGGINDATSVAKSNTAAKHNTVTKRTAATGQKSTNGIASDNKGTVAKSTNNTANAGSDAEESSVNASGSNTRSSAKSVTAARAGNTKLVGANNVTPRKTNHAASNTSAAIAGATTDEATAKDDNAAKTAENGGVAGVTNAIANVDNNSDHSKAGLPGDKKDDKMVLNSSAASVKATHAADVAKTTEASNATNKDHSVNSGAVAAKTAASHSSDKTASTAAAKKKTTAKSSTAVVSSVKSGTTTTNGELTSATEPAKYTGGKMPTTKTPSTTEYSTGGVAPKATKPEAVNYGKKVITKMVLHERLVKTGDDKNDYIHKLDTISIDRVNMELGGEEATTADETAAKGAGAQPSNTGTAAMAKNAKPGNGRHGGHAARKASGAAGTTGAGVSAATAAGTEEESGASRPAGTLAAAGISGEDADESEIMPAAKAPAVAANATSSEEGHAETADSKAKATTAKKGSGISMLKKLTLAFNDVKQNASTAQFVPGIIAGINSNFFGPTSFKGFQFGVTGNLIFNNQWNIMAELKYFHRINNNTSVEDNYATYTQVGNQYRRDQLLNSWGFSTLHSVEVPVAIRYSKGNFNFYTGGNFLYSFSINTGAATIPDYNAAPEYVNTPGTDNAPNFKEEDFKSRFGLGYLFGFSYQVAPNFNIDLRSVQTVWDNAATTGAKSISTQLYKSPSLQLSIMYRLGGNRSKD